MAIRFSLVIVTITYQNMITKDLKIPFLKIGDDIIQDGRQACAVLILKCHKYYWQFRSFEFQILARDWMVEKR